MIETTQTVHVSIEYFEVTDPFVNCTAKSTLLIYTKTIYSWVPPILALYNAVPLVTETMRLYGTAQVLSRVCTQPYKIPDSDLVLDKGSKVIIPLYSLHHDPKYYSEPYEFKPERFSPEESKERHPFVFLPFGEGPRNCIGRVF